MQNEHFKNMIKKFTHTIIRTGKTLQGKIPNTEFSIPTLKEALSIHKEYNPKTKKFFVKKGRGHEKIIGENHRFNIISLDYPRISYMGCLDDYSDYQFWLHLWGKDKSKDNILIEKELPTEKIAQEFLDFINKIGTYVS